MDRNIQKLKLSADQAAVKLCMIKVDADMFS